MIVTIVLTTAGSSTGPFNLYSDLDGYTTPFEVGVPKAVLIAGYTSTLVPDGTTVIRVATGEPCNTYIDIVIGATTTTTTTAVPTTTTTTTFIASGCLSLTLGPLVNEPICEGSLNDTYRTVTVTLLDGPGGSPILAPTNIDVVVDATNCNGPAPINLTILSGSSSASDIFYTRVWSDCETRDLCLGVIGSIESSSPSYPVCSDITTTTTTTVLV